MMGKRIITVSREFGSGGRFIGMEVAQKLGVKYYDKEMIGQIAEQSGFSPKYIQENAELSPKKGLFAYAFSGRDQMGRSVEDMIYEAQRKIIIEKYGEKFVNTIAFYTKDNVFFLPEISRWSYIMENAKQSDIALKIDTALYTIEKSNPSLKGALPDNYYSRLHIDTTKLASLLDEIDKINTGDKENDIIGRIYEYFLSKFALAEGKGKGEFYTPKCIVNLIAEMIEPYDGILYDEAVA